MYIQNLHTHTCYCDGADTPGDIITTALEKNFTSIGFSGHSYATYSQLLAKYGDRTEAYKKDVLDLKKRYEDRIKIYLGLEVDMYSNPDMNGYDFLIGSVHYLKCAGEYVNVDRPVTDVENGINRYFSGDGMKYAKAYYETVAQLPQYGRFDIIGHFDLITKQHDIFKFFDISS